MDRWFSTNLGYFSCFYFCPPNEAIRKEFDLTEQSKYIATLN